MVVNLRMLAVDSLIEIFEENRHSHIVISEVLNKYQYIEKQERAFYQRLTFGTIERKLFIDYVIDSFSNKPVKKMRPVMRYILETGVYQILYMDSVPDSAACNEAVKIAKKRGFSSLSGFVNAILRKVCANKENITLPDKNANPVEYLSIAYSTPEWLVREWCDKYGYEKTKAILSKQLTDKSTTIRCNKLLITPNELSENLKSEGVGVKQGAYVEDALIISEFDSVTRLKGYEEGHFYVQDESSMLAVRAAGINSDDFVVDVCAAPGGKSLYAAYFASAGKVISRDLTENKTDIIAMNAKRCKAENVVIEVRDALELDEALVGKADVVIADLPCSGLGIIGKKPDIKLKMTKEQIIQLSNLQKEILKVVSSYVKPKGVMIYSTCTNNSVENEENVEWVVNNLGFETESLDEYIPKSLHNEDSKSGYMTLLPGINECDGFFISRLRKKQ